MSGNDLSRRDRSEEIRGKFPRFIAQSYADALARTEDYEAVTAYLRMVEIILRYLTVCAWARYIALDPDGLNGEAAFVENLARPAMGKWLEALRKVDRALEEHGNGNSALGCSLTKHRDNLPGFLRPRHHVFEKVNAQKASIHDVFDLLIQLRNDESHPRDPQGHRRQPRRLRPVLEEAVEELLLSIPTLLQWHPVYVASSENLRSGYHQVTSFAHRGEGMPRNEDVRHPSTIRLTSDTLYLKGPDDKFVELWPFAFADSKEISVFAGVDRGAATFHSTGKLDIDEGMWKATIEALKQRAPALFKMRGSLDALARLEPFMKLAAIDAHHQRV